MADSMDDEHTADAVAKVFQQDQARFRRVERAQLIGLALMLGVFAGAVCDTPLWPLGLGLVTVWAISFTIAFRRRWNADPPTLTFDTIGITYRYKYVAITFKERSVEEHLGWSQIEVIEIYEGGGLETRGLTGVVVRPIQADARSEIAFQPSMVGATESDLVEVLTRFAPERLRVLVDKRPARLGKPRP
jgi:hypothetical protein